MDEAVEQMRKRSNNEKDLFSGFWCLDGFYGLGGFFAFFFLFASFAGWVHPHHPQKKKKKKKNRDGFSSHLIVEPQDSIT